MTDKEFDDGLKAVMGDHFQNGRYSENIYVSWSRTQMHQLY